MAFKNIADTSSRNVYDFSHEPKTVVWLRVVSPLLLDQNQRCFLTNKSKEEKCKFPTVKRFGSFRISLRWPILIINPVDKTKLSLTRTPTDAAPQFL